MPSPTTADPSHSSTTDDLVVYATTWCPYCQQLIAGLRATKIPFQVVDVDEDEAGAEFVRAANNGNRTVPTVLFPDGSVRTNPTVTEVAQLLSRPS